MTPEQLKRAKEQATLMLIRTNQALPQPRQKRKPRTFAPRTLPVGVYHSGYPDNPYRARVNVGGKLIGLGHFKTVEDAERAVLERKEQK